MRSNGCLRAAPHDRARDLPRVALLAVAAEDVGELPLARLVDDIGRGQVGGGIHAHVERRVGGVGEAALGPVELHRRDAEVEQDRVGAHAVRARAARAPARTRRAAAAPWPRSCAGAARSTARRSGRGRSRSACPRRAAARRAARSARRRRRCSRRPSRPAAARGRRAPRPRGRGRDQSRLARRSATSSALPSACLQLLAPRGAIPDLEVVEDAGDRHLALDARAVEQLGRDHHPSLLVELDRRRAGEEVALHRPRLAAERVERADPRRQGPRTRPGNRRRGIRPGRA